MTVDGVALGALLVALGLLLGGFTASRRAREPRGIERPPWRGTPPHAVGEAAKPAAKPVALPLETGRPSPRSESPSTAAVDSRAIREEPSAAGPQEPTPAEQIGDVVPQLRAAAEPGTADVSGTQPLAPEPVERAPIAPMAPELTPKRRTRLRDVLAKSRAALGLGAIFRSSGLDEMIPALEEALVAADVGIPATEGILESLRKRIGKNPITEESVRRDLSHVLEEALGEPGDLAAGPAPRIMLILGVNGVGKTTTIGKLSARLAGDGKKVLLVAGDTYRAAAVEQLGAWAERTGAELVKHQSGSDPGAVAFDGVKAAVARGVDVVLIDTAGRLHTRDNLMEELRKMGRVVGKALEGAPHEVLLVLDATTGQNSLQQAKAFSEALGVTGIVLTKLDGTARGGSALAVRRELGVPISFIGVGEGVEDLRPFSPGEFARALVGLDEEAA